MTRDEAAAKAEKAFCDTINSGAAPKYAWIAAFEALGLIKFGPEPDESTTSAAVLRAMEGRFIRTADGGFTATPPKVTASFIQQLHELGFQIVRRA